MTAHNPNNERMKRQYLVYLKDAKGQSEATLDAVANALARFEAETSWRDFRTFHYHQATAFKSRLATKESETTGKPLSKATICATLSHLKRFFQWLALQPRYKARLRYADAEYFNPTDKDMRVATARRERPFPTLEQVKQVVAIMPDGSDIERRDRALVAFILLTGARDGAVASMKLKHIDLIAGRVNQDAREVKTKFSKTFTTFFFPVGDAVRQIVVDWVIFLREERLWSHDDPLFPATRVGLDEAGQFNAAGLKREHWSNAASIREIFRNAFKVADLPYFNPHSLRNTLVQLGQTVCRTPEEFKVWSQNLGHEDVLTTFCSYGAVGTHRQGEIIRSLGEPRPAERSDVDAIADAVARRLEHSHARSRPESLRDGGLE
jgi:integrase/recombinase XerD